MEDLSSNEPFKYEGLKNPPTQRTMLRGWFHLLFSPFVLGATIPLIALANYTQEKFAVAIYMTCSLILFSVSGVYHVFNWGEKMKLFLRRLDHCNIFLLIAGTYTPLCLSAMPWENPGCDFFSGKTLLIVIWTLSTIGLIFHLIWIKAPRVLYVVLYIFLGVFSVIYIPTILTFTNPFSIAIAVNLCCGGVFYITGAVFYAIKFPGKTAKIFGFHELFHTLVIAAWITHCVSIYFGILG